MFEVSVMRFFIVSFNRLYDEYLGGFFFTIFLKFIAKFVVSRCAFCKLRRNFVPSIILVDLLGNTCLFVIGAFRSTFKLFVSVFQGSLPVIALFRTVSGNDRLVFFEAFYDLSYSCLLQG